ncbi:MAG: [protein-PII] uridylyltransferase [Thermodesulfobacteriota bacterium]
MKHKQEIQASRETLQKLWEGGVSGLKLLEDHTAAIDSFLAARFAELSEGDLGLTLVALGGYGRRELFPFSDIDLLLLHSPRVKGAALEKATEAILYPLWDAGLEVGHSVRTVSQCIKDGKHDFHLQIAMLDARKIAGSEKLFVDLAAKYKRKFIDGRRKDFLKNMQAERENRARQFGGHSFQLEPSIKEGRGGFRDIQSMLWTARVVYGLKKLSDIEESGIFRAADREALEDSFNTLVMIRNRLHYLSGRKNDQLFFEHQEEIATALGYRATSGKLGVEVFMQEVYGHLQNIAITTDLFFEHIHETIGPGRAGQDDGELEKGLAVIHGRIHLTDLKLLPEKPHLLLKTFRHRARTGLPIHFQTRQVISLNLDLVNDSFRSSRRAAALFFELLVAAADPLPPLSAMLETGFLSAFIPEFGSLESLAQHDVFHVYTVDRHLLQTVRELRILADEQKRVFTELRSFNVLYLAGLLHDIGKGRDGDHEKIGAEISLAVGKRLSLSEEELSDLEFLIRNHLYLSHVAQRRDLEDEEVVFQCAELIGNRDRLNMLYLLSIADARATGPKAWSEWKGALLQELYLRVAPVLDQSEIVDPDLEQAARWMRGQVSEIINDTSPEELAFLPDDYLLGFTVQEVVGHLGMRQKLEENKALVMPADHADHWSVLVVSCDRSGFLSRICGTLALNNLSVLSARINTWGDGTIIDVLEVKPVFRNTFREQDWQALDRDINLALENRLGLAHRLATKKITRRSEPGLEHRQYSTNVKVNNDVSSKYTLIEVFAEDQPSLLYNITRTMADFDLNIAKAMISTREGQLIDVFYVLDANGDKLSGASYLDELRQALLFASS